MMLSDCVFACCAFGVETAVRSCFHESEWFGGLSSAFITLKQLQTIISNNHDHIPGSHRGRNGVKSHPVLTPTEPGKQRSKFHILLSNVSDALRPSPAKNSTKLAAITIVSRFVANLLVQRVAMLLCKFYLFITDVSQQAATKGDG